MVAGYPDIKKDGYSAKFATGQSLREANRYVKYALFYGEHTEIKVFIVKKHKTLKFHGYLYQNHPGLD